MNDEDRGKLYLKQLQTSIGLVMLDSCKKFVELTCSDTLQYAYRNKSWQVCTNRNVQAKYYKINLNL